MQPLFRIFTHRIPFSLCIFRRNSTALLNQTFRYEDLQVTLASDYGMKGKPDLSNLVFGQTFSDHMFEVEWNETDGWGPPKIVPVHFFQMHPGSKVLHYAQAAFEGMKAYRHPDQTVAMFRPELNMKRLASTAERTCLPSFDGNELMKCIKKLISIDKQWVPDEELSSLYIRPTFIGNQDSLGVTTSNNAILYVVTCPVGPYFKTGLKPVSLLADPRYVRACPGGVGAYKMAANYAPSLYVQKLAQQKGYDQVLWLLGQEHKVAEAGAMNAFFLIKKSNSSRCELVTPDLDGTILPGVVRQSVLELARDWNEFDVSERTISMNEIIKANKEKRLLEMFLCGTACSVCPVKLIKFKEEDISIPTMENTKPLFSRFLETLTNIQYGRVKSNWTVSVD